MKISGTSRLFVFLFFLIVSAFIQDPPLARAATIEVDTAVDELDGASGNGSCSLREAIANANQNNGAQVDCAAGSGADVITFSADLNGTPLLLSLTGIGEDANATGDLDVTDDLTITGNGVNNTVIDANSIDRVLHVFGNVAVTIDGVTIQNGYTAVLGDLGGGIYNQGGTLVIQRSHITGNYAEEDIGGGIANVDGSLTILDSAIFNNRTDLTGGGILSTNRFLDAAIITTEIVNTTISGNEAGNAGGGVTNATESAGDATLILTNSTITANMAGLIGGMDQGGGVSNHEFGGGTAATYLQNSIVVGNGSPHDGTYDCFTTSISGSGVIISNGHNLVGADQGCPSDGSGDQTTAVPDNDVSLTLADNGGPTFTHALPPFSLALDAGDNAACAASPVNNLDQRGEPRPVDYTQSGTATCDVGAFERQTDETVTLPLHEGQTQTFGAAMVTITDNPGGNAPGLVSITRFSQAPGVPNMGEMPFHLSIDATVNSGLDLNLTICYADAEVAAGAAVNEALLQLYRYNDLTRNWEPMGVDALDTAANCATKNNVTAFSSWTLASAQPTAVSLQSAAAGNGNDWPLLIVGVLGLCITAVFLWRRRVIAPDIL